MKTPESGLLRAILVAVALALAVSARIAVGTIGWNFDVESWAIVADAVDRGLNVYATTDRYNYGPIWSWFLVLGKTVADLGGDQFWNFRLFLSGILALVDVEIAILLKRRFGMAAAAWFLFCPVSIIISGFQRQFGNVAVLIVLAAALLLEGRDRGERGRLWAPAFLIGLSLSVKHLFFAFPAWLALRDGSIRRRLVLFAIPPILFLGLFLPYWPEGREGIIHHVFLYRSFANAPVWNLIVPSIVRPFFPPMALFAVALATVGFAARTMPPVRSVLLYTAALVAFSPAVANQYLAIPIAFCAVYRNGFSLLYMALASVYLTAGLKLWGLDRWVPLNLIGYPMQCAVLAMAVVWVLWSRWDPERRNRLTGKIVGRFSKRIPNHE